MRENIYTIRDKRIIVDKRNEIGQDSARKFLAEATILDVFRRFAYRSISRPRNGDKEFYQNTAHVVLSVLDSIYIEIHLIRECPFEKMGLEIHGAKFVDVEGVVSRYRGNHVRISLARISFSSASTRFSPLAFCRNEMKKRTVQVGECCKVPRKAFN